MSNLDRPTLIPPPDERDLEPVEPREAILVGWFALGFLAGVGALLVVTILLAALLR